jgi:hypothetical protein
MAGATIIRFQSKSPTIGRPCGRSALGAQRLLQTHCIVENTNPHLQPLLFERARYLFQ